MDFLKSGRFRLDDGVDDGGIKGVSGFGSAIFP